MDAGTTRDIGPAIEDGMASLARSTEATDQAAATLPRVGPLDLDDWQNSLGMRFSALPGVNTMICAFPTRVSDYEAFARAVGVQWLRPPFEQGPDHPTVLVSWEGACSFCAWLTEKESKTGWIRSDQQYRLPRDAEWSLAAGVSEEIGSTPKQKGMRGVSRYPWGTKWRVPGSDWNFGYLNYGTTPEGTSPANPLGLQTLSGNVWEWCEDRHSDEGDARVLRGGSWRSVRPELLRLTCRIGRDPAWDSDDAGFRVVLESCALRGSNVPASAVDTVSGTNGGGIQ